MEHLARVGRSVSWLLRITQCPADRELTFARHQTEPVTRFAAFTGNQRAQMSGQKRSSKRSEFAGFSNLFRLKENATVVLAGKVARFHREKG